jgi:hypothetical protein
MPVMTTMKMMITRTLARLLWEMRSYWVAGIDMVIIISCYVPSLFGHFRCCTSRLRLEMRKATSTVPLSTAPVTLLVRLENASNIEGTDTENGHYLAKFGVALRQSAITVPLSTAPDSLAWSPPNFIQILREQILIAGITNWAFSLLRVLDTPLPSGVY